MATQRKYQLEIEGQIVAITNPDKVMFPSGFTKGQVIDYYVWASEYLLPHLRDRPVTLKRYPDGTQARISTKKMRRASRRTGSRDMLCPGGAGSRIFTTS